MSLSHTNTSAGAARQFAHDHPILLSLAGFSLLAVVVLAIQHVRAANPPAAAPASSSAANAALALASEPAPSAAGRMVDGRENHTQVRFDNVLITPVAGWKKRGLEWGGQHTLEAPGFDKNRNQITAHAAVGLDEKGLQALADKVYKDYQFFKEFKEEAKPVEARHPSGYRTLMTFTSVSATGYGADCRLYMMDVFLEANGVASRIHYAGAYRENFDKLRPAFDQYLKDLRLLSGQTLAQGFDDQPPLDQFTINQCCDFIEWLLDVPLTDTQRLAARDHLIAAWQRKDKAEASGLWEIFKARNELDKMDKQKKELGRVAAREEVIKEWRAEAAKGDKMARMMIEVYDQAHKSLAQGKDGEPPLTRQQADATLEILHFMASKVAGFDVGPSEQQKNEFATKLAGQYPTMPPENKKEITQMPLYWAWFRAVWPELSNEDRTKLVQQWSAEERIKPIVAQIQEAKAKAIASGSHPDAFLDATRKLYQQQQQVAMISNMMAMQHRTNMMVINNIGSSNYRYEYKYVYRYR